MKNAVLEAPRGNRCFVAGADGCLPLEFCKDTSRKVSSDRRLMANPDSARPAAFFFFFLQPSGFFSLMAGVLRSATMYEMKMSGQSTRELNVVVHKDLHLIHFTALTHRTSLKPYQGAGSVTWGEIK